MYESAPQNEPVVPPELSEDGATYAEVARWNEQQVAYAETLATDPAFTRTLYRAASRRGSQSPDDLVQDAIIKTINGVRDIDTAISFAGRLGTQLAIDQHRRRVSKARVEDLFGRLHAPLSCLKL